MEQRELPHKGKQEKSQFFPYQPVCRQFAAGCSSDGTLNDGLRSETLAMGKALGALEKRVEEGIKVQGRYFVAAPAEMVQLGSPVAAEAFAQWHGWMFVNHMNGEHYEFFEATPGQELYSEATGA